MQRLGGWHTRGLCVAERMMYGHALIGNSAVTPNVCAWFWIWEEPHTVAGQLLWRHSSLAVSWLVSARRLHVLILLPNSFACCHNK